MTPLQAHPAQRRHRRDPDQQQRLSQPRLAELRQDHPRAEQDPARHQRQRAGKGGGSRPEAARARGPPAGRAAEPGDARADGVGASDYGYSKPRTCTLRWAGARCRRGRCSPSSRRRPSRPKRQRPPPPPLTPQEREAFKDYVVQVKGLDDLLTYLAKCCNPIRGEPIVGYITRGKGVAVHSRTCPNVMNLMYEAERRIEVEWARTGAENFHVRLVVHTDDRTGMLNQLTQILFSTRRSTSAASRPGRRKPARRRRCGDDHRGPRQKAARADSRGHAPRSRSP
jgi:hypothetical protein